MTACRPMPWEPAKWHRQHNSYGVYFNMSPAGTNIARYVYLTQLDSDMTTQLPRFASSLWSLSVVLYDRPGAQQSGCDKDFDRDEEWQFLAIPQHMTLAIYPTGDRLVTCHLHDVRPNDKTREFVYKAETTNACFNKDHRVRGCMDLVQFMNAQEARQTYDILAVYGADRANLPIYGAQTCHEWIAGAVEALEQAALLIKGEARFWKSVTGRTPLEIVDSARDRRRYKANPHFSGGYRKLTI